MTRKYELVYIFDSALEETQINERLERFHSLLTSPETPEPVTLANHWGKRSLAYAIQGKSVGYYVVVQFNAQPDMLGELERQLKLDESVLRYLIVLNEGPAPVVPAPRDGPGEKGAATREGPADKSAPAEEAAADKSAPAEEAPADTSASDDDAAGVSAATDEGPADTSAPAEKAEDDQ